MEGDTHSFGVVNKGVRLVVAEADVDQVLHPVLPLFLAHVALEKGAKRAAQFHRAARAECLGRSGLNQSSNQINDANRPAEI